MRYGRTDHSFVLVSQFPPPVNGLSQATRDLESGLKARGWCLLGVNYGSLKRSRRERTVAIAHAVVRSLAIYVKRPSIAYVCIGQSTKAAVRDLAIMWPFLLGRGPVIAHLHGGRFGEAYRNFPRWLQVFYRLLMGRLTCFIMLDERFIADAHEVLPSVDTAIVPNAVPPTVTRDLAGRHSSWRADAPFTVCFLSNLHPDKGLLEVLGAVEVLLDRGVPVRLEVGGGQEPGGGHVVESLEASIARHPGDIVYHAVVTGEQKVDLLLRAQCFALPTRYVNEGQPIALLEAMAAGLPVLSTNYRAIPSLITNRVEGILLDDVDPASLVNAIIEMMDRGRWERYSSAARMRAREFSIERYVGAIEKIAIGAIETA